jgi:hypothetical protein
MANKGDFRVVINGFRVMAETYDDVLQLDGKRDEVFIMAGVKEGTSDGTIHRAAVQSDRASPSPKSCQPTGGSSKEG